MGVVGLALTACVDTERVNLATAGLDKDPAPKLQIAPKCPWDLCPRLDASVSAHMMRRLFSNHAGTDEGFSLVTADVAGVPVEVEVHEARLFAYETAPPYAVLHGPALQGLTLLVSHQSGELSKLVVESVSFQDLHFWEGDAKAVEAYEITARRVDPPDPNPDPSFICSGTGTESDPRWGGVPHVAILFEGEHFDFAHETIEQPQPAEFNVACVGSNMAAMHLSRHTNASNEKGQFPTTLEQRVAMLKMFAADYCGNGTSYTFDNYPVLWLDDTGFAQPPLDLDPAHGQISSIEAIWGADRTFRSTAHLRRTAPPCSMSRACSGSSASRDDVRRAARSAPFRARRGSPPVAPRRR
jgi:hypothetical protein